MIVSVRGGMGNVSTWRVDGDCAKANSNGRQYNHCTIENFIEVIDSIVKSYAKPPSIENKKVIRIANDFMIDHCAESRTRTDTPLRGTGF